jgi:hypothetical protein
MATFSGPFKDTTGSIYDIDLANSKSYSGSGLTVFNLFGPSFGGTLINNPTILSSLGGIVQFDGVDDYIDFYYNEQTLYANNFTVLFVARPYASYTLFGESDTGVSGANNQKYLINPAYVDPGAGVGVALGTNGLQVMEHSAGYLPIHLSYGADLTGFNHYALVYENKTAKLYINGGFAKTGLTSNRTNVYYRLNNWIGKGSYGIYSGELMYLQSYSRVLSDSEIKQSYDTFKSRFTYPYEIAGTGLTASFDPGSSLSLLPGASTLYNTVPRRQATASLRYGASVVGSGLTTYINLAGAGSTQHLVTTSVQFIAVSMMVYIDSTQTGNPYLMDARNGINNSWVYADPVGPPYGTAWSKLYVNGVRQTISNSNGIGNTSIYPRNTWLNVYLELSSIGTATVNIGSRYTATEALKARFGAVQFFTSPLSASEILQNYRIMSGRYS